MDMNRQKLIKNIYDMAEKAYADMCLYELYNKPFDKNNARLYWIYNNVKSSPENQITR